MRFELALAIDSPQWRRSTAFAPASAFDAGTGLITLPSWLTITCATTGRTSQQSASTLKSGFGANAARGRNVGSGLGLSVERAMTNAAWWSSALDAWTLQTDVVVDDDAANGPDGTALADELDLSAAADGAGALIDSDDRLAAKTISIWAKQSGAAATINLTNPATSSPDLDLVLASNWQRFDLGSPSGADTGLFLRRKPSGNNKGLFCFAQSELGGYPTSALPAAGAADATRAADVLACTDPTVLAPGGFFDVAIVYAPNYAHDEAAADHDLLFLDAGNRLYWKQSDQKIYAHFGGEADIVSPALTFARETQLMARSQYTADGRRLVVINGGAVVYDSGPLSAGSAISLPATAYLMGNATGAQECADLRGITVYRL